MTKITGYFLATGPLFSPSAAEARARVRFTRKNEPGEKGTSGRHRGKAIPYGSGEIIDDASGATLLTRESPLVAQARAAIDACRDAMATSLQLHLDVQYSGQCNLEMEPDFMHAVAQLGVAFTLTCFET